MNTIGMLLAIVGAVIGLVGGIMLLIVAFKENIGWGIACILIPCLTIVFAIMHWEKAKKPFLIELVGAAICSVGNYLMKPPAG